MNPNEELNEYQRDYLELSDKYLALVVIRFYEHGGRVAKSKLTISGHTIPCSKCGGNARRYIPGELKPICNKCWNKKIDAGLNELCLRVALRMAVDSFCENMEGSDESE